MQCAAGRFDRRAGARLARLVLAGCVVGAAVLLPAGCGLGSDSERLIDSDGDGLPDRRERRLGTDPFNADTDFDGRADGDELEAGTSPLARDSDGDGIDDGDEIPNDPESPRNGSASTGNDLEPNDSFARAVGLMNPVEDVFTVEGQIDRRGDVDVFDLGGMRRGDRVLVDFQRRDPRFRPSVALFGPSEEVVATGEDPFVRNGPDISGLIDAAVLADGHPYYLAVSHPGADAVLGAYRLEISIERAAGVLPARPQTLVLDFSGGVPASSILGLARVEAFSAGSIAAVYGADNELIKAIIVETVVGNFAGLDVEIVTSDDVVPADLAASTLWLGSFSPMALGAAQGIDAFNLDCCDDAIVFTESFGPNVFGFAPSSEALAVAIGNVAAHEAGHLLGLRHVTQPTAIMDELSPGVHLLTDQRFEFAPLADSVFPIGFQNAPELLAETVGLLPGTMDR